VKLLTIAIPTYRRASALNEVLFRLKDQLGKEERDLVDVVVHDNASPDATRFTCSGYDFVQYRRNDENVGPFRNQMLCVSEAKTPYVWVICDDDLPDLRAVPRLLKVLKIEGPDLIVSDLTLDGPGVVDQFNPEYDSATEFLRDALRISPRYLLCVGGWSQVVFRRNAFDLAEWAMAMRGGSIYPHHHALWSGRGIHRISVIRAPIASGREVILPTPDRRVSAVPSDYHWRDCVRLLNSVYNVGAPEDILSKVYSKDHLGNLFSHPIRTIVKYSPILACPRNWYKIAWRLWHYFV